jgi:photosystem II stability/assembly factor-like uncharacterized protein
MSTSIRKIILIQSVLIFSVSCSHDRQEEVADIQEIDLSSVSTTVADPMTQLKDEAFIQTGGCWASLFSGKDFKGKRLNLYNQMNLSDLTFSGRSDWEGKARSLIVGPQAGLVLYTERSFAGEEYFAEPKTYLAGSVTMPFLQVKSLRLECLP